MAYIPTTEGPREPSQDDLDYMDYLDELAELPGDFTFGLLLFKADPMAFDIGRDEWLEQAA